MFYSVENRERERKKAFLRFKSDRSSDLKNLKPKNISAICNDKKGEPKRMENI